MWSNSKQFKPSNLSGFSCLNGGQRSRALQMRVAAYPRYAEPDIILRSCLLQNNRRRLGGRQLVRLVLEGIVARLDPGRQRSVHPNAYGAVTAVPLPHSHSHLGDILRFVEGEGQLADHDLRYGRSARPAGLVFDRRVEGVSWHAAVRSAAEAGGVVLMSHPFAEALAPVTTSRAADKHTTHDTPSPNHSPGQLGFAHNGYID